MSADDHKESEPASFEVLATIADSVADARFERLLDDLRTRFGNGTRSRSDEGNISGCAYFVFETRPRAVEFSCDPVEREVVCAWLGARDEVSEIRVDLVE